MISREEEKRSERASGKVLSRRAVSYVTGAKLSTDSKYVEWLDSKYDPIENRHGVIHLGIAANDLVFDVIKERISENGFFDGLTQKHVNVYFGGVSDISDALSAFVSKHAKSAKPIKRENIVVMNGVTTVIHCLMQVLCDEGDAVLIPTPLYLGFVDDLSIRSNVSIAPVHLSSEKGANEKPFHLTVDLLEQSFQEAIKNGRTVKALLITTPHNPLGYIYRREELLSFMHFCKRHQLHFVSDEIYLTTIFGEGEEAVSSLSIDENPLDTDHFHVLYGISKDFAANGLRVGALISWSDLVLQSIRALEPFSQTSNLACYVFSKLLFDEKWLEQVFFPTNRRRLLASYQCTAKFFDSFENISHIRTGSGLFVWLDLRKLLDEPTFEAEAKLADEIFKASRVIVNPGKLSLCKEPGWFRLIFALPIEHLEEAFERMKAVLVGHGAKLESGKEAC